MKNRLERFLVKHCYSLGDFRHFKNVINVTDDNEWFKNNREKLVMQAIPVFKSMKNKSVINGSSNFYKLFNLLNDQVSANIEIDLKGRT